MVFDEITSTIKRIRKEHNILANWQAYLVNHEVWEHFKREAKKEYEIVEIYDKLQKHLQYGSIIKDNFALFRMEDIDYGDRIFLFTTSIDAFYKENFYKKPIKREKIVIGTGTYKIVDTMFGKTFKKIDFSKEDSPILNDNIKETLKKEIKAFIDKEELYKEMNLTYKRGILLHGGAGNGKTCFIKSIAHEMREEAIVIITENINEEINYIESFLADDDYNKYLKIIVFEDIDGFHPSIRSKMLNFLDGANKMHKVLFIATTNFPEKLDIAIKNRPSRFDDIKNIGLPNEQTRKRLLLKYFPNTKKELLEKAIRKSDGLSGSHFKELYILSRLNNWELNQTIEEVKNRFKAFEIE